MPATLVPWQAELDGLIMGWGTVFDWVDAPSFGPPPEPNSGDVLKATEHGVHPGVDLMPGRLVEWRMWVLGNTAADMYNLRDAFYARWQAVPLITSGTTRHLRLMLPNYDEPRLVKGRPGRCADNLEKAKVGLGVVAVQFKADNPRVFGDTEREAIVAAGSNVPVTNSGNMNTHPFVIIEGPVTNPLVTNAVTGEYMGLHNYSIPTGQTLEIDFEAHTLRHFTNPAAGVFMSVPRYKRAGSRWWKIGPGAGTVVFTGSGGRARIRWRDTWAA